MHASCHFSQGIGPFDCPSHQVVEPLQAVSWHVQSGELTGGNLQAAERETGQSSAVTTC